MTLKFNFKKREFTEEWKVGEYYMCLIEDHGQKPGNIYQIRKIDSVENTNLLFKYIIFPVKESPLEEIGGIDEKRIRKLTKQELEDHLNSKIINM